MSARPVLQSVLGSALSPALGEGVGVLLSSVAIFGDSTAAFTGVSEYGRGWGWMFAKDPTVQWEFYNAGVGGETSAAMLARVTADTDHRRWPTIFMDRPNTGETSPDWLNNMKAAAALIPHNRWVVMPPVLNSPGAGGDTSGTAIGEVQAALLSDPFFAGHTLDTTDQAAYRTALNDDATRVGSGDFVHFNDLGQAIQCLFVSALFYQQGWRVDAQESIDLAARMSTPPTTRRRSFQNALIERQKRLGAWDKRDAFYVLAAADSQAAGLNWVANQYDLTPVNSPVFLADAYYKGNGFGDCYLASGFNPTTAPSPKFALNSAHMGVWSRTNLQNGANPAYEIGNTLSRVQRDTTSGLGRTRPNYFSTRDIGAAAFPGDAMWSRTAASVWEGYSNGLDSGGGVDTASGLTNAAFTIGGLADAAVGGVNELSMAYWGSGLTATEAAQDYHSKSAYLRAVGAI